MLARLLRWILALQVLGGALLGVWLGLLGAAWWGGSGALVALLLGAVLLPLVVHTVVLGMGFAWARAVQGQPGGWWRAYAAEWRAAWTVFVGRQPFSTRSPGVLAPTTAPPHGGAHAGSALVPLPVLLVHGYVCNHRVWDELAAALRARGHTVLAVDLEPIFAPIEQHADALQAAAQTLLRTSRARSLVAVGHSMGGLALRAWLAAHGDAKVAGIITLGTPHQGTLMAHAAHTPNGVQMRPHSPWLQALAAAEPTSRRARMHLALSTHDNVVFPQLVQTLPGANVQVFDGLGHLELCRAPAVIEWVCQTVAACHPARANPRGGRA